MASNKSISYLCDFHGFSLASLFTVQSNHMRHLTSRVQKQILTYGIKKDWKYLMDRTHGCHATLPQLNFFLPEGRSRLLAILRITTSLVVQLVKNPPAMRETWVRSLGWEDPLEKGKATHSSILAWRIP